MKNKYWFKPKKYGYGFCPTSIEGWLATLVLVALLFTAAYVNGIHNEMASDKDGLRFLLDVFLISGVASWFFEKKTEGELKWRWGNKK